MDKKLTLSDFTLRRALKSDYADVLAISSGVFGGRDIIPAVYFDYLDDPNRVFYVAVNNRTGKVASLAGVRIIDNGETFEGEGARTDHKLRGTGLYISRALRNHLSIDIIQKYPNLKKGRFVTVTVSAFRKDPKFSIIFMRNVRDIIWKMPTYELLQHLARLRGDISNGGLPLDHIQKATRCDVEYLFKDSASQSHLFPRSVLVRDSQTFSIGVKYLSNIPLLLGDRLHAIYISRGVSGSTEGKSHSDTGKFQGHMIKSISFGTGIESDVTLENMRYCIDYYGDPDIDVIKSHVIKHLWEIPQCLHKSNTANVVCCNIFMPEYVTNVINGEDIVKFVHRDLGFGSMPSEYTDQCVAINKNDLNKFASKL